MIVADIEATGIDYRKHSLLSIGAVDFFNPNRQFYGECRMWDGATMMTDSLAVNGFTEAECRDPKKHSLAELMQNFFHWMEQCEDKTLAGHNVSFDRDYLNDSFLRAGIDYRFAYRTIDLHSLAYADMKHKGIAVPIKNEHSGLSLDTILEYVGLPREPKPHVGLNGAKYTAEAFSRLMYGKNLLPEFAEFPLR
jgi:DNA polymerase III epsilon subunit-like protein